MEMKVCKVDRRVYVGFPNTNLEVLPLIAETLRFEVRDAWFATGHGSRAASTFAFGHDLVDSSAADSWCRRHLYIAPLRHSLRSLAAAQLRLFMVDCCHGAAVSPEGTQLKASNVDV